MNINIRYKDTVTIVDLEGNIDINASDLVETMGWAVNSRSKDILCNFEKVNLVDYVGISVIAVAYKNVLNHEGRLKLYAVPAHILKLFKMVGMDKALECYETEEQALNSFKEDKEISRILSQQLRRNFKRIPFRGTIEYRPQLSQEKFYKGKILNLSAVGVFMVGKKIFPVGQMLSTRIRLSSKTRPLQIDAKVVWLADEQIQLLESPGMGLEFCDIDTDKQRVIVEFVEKNLASTNL